MVNLSLNFLANIYTYFKTQGLVARKAFGVYMSCRVALFACKCGCEWVLSLSLADQRASFLKDPCLRILWRFLSKSPGALLKYWLHRSDPASVVSRLVHQVGSLKPPSFLTKRLLGTNWVLVLPATECVSSQSWATRPNLASFRNSVINQVQV